MVGTHTVAHTFKAVKVAGAAAERRADKPVKQRAVKALAGQALRLVQNGVEHGVRVAAVAARAEQAGIAHALISGGKVRIDETLVIQARVERRGFSYENFGVLLAVTYCLRRAKQFGVTQDDILNLVLICLPSAIVGARLYYVIFEWDQFFGPGIPWYRFLDIRSGGLAIYGGVIGAVLGMLIYTRVRKLKIFPCLDLTGIGLLLGQAIGRWGNFFNREAHGSVTTCFLRMGLVENGELQYFHPTFLYESVWNLTGFVVLHFLSKKRKFDGQMFLAYLAWYGAGRMVIEGLRTDSLWLGPVRVSQLLAAVTMLLALGILLYHAIFVRHDPAKMQVNRMAAAEAAETQPEEGAEPSGEASEQEDEASEESEESIGPDESKE